MALSPAEKRNKKVMKIGKFKKMFEKAIKENEMTDKDEILIVNADKGELSNIADVSVSHYSDGKKRIVILNLY